MTFRELMDAMRQSGDDDEDVCVGGLQSAVVGEGCSGELVLLLDADQDSDPDQD